MFVFSPFDKVKSLIRLQQLFSFYKFINVMINRFIICFIKVKDLHILTSQEQAKLMSFFFQLPVAYKFVVVLVYFSK